MKVFNASIEQMLWPERRRKDDIFANDTGPGVGVIDRTTEVSRVRVARGFVPDGLRPLLGFGQRAFPMLVSDDGIVLPNIPKGTPVNLLASIDLLGADEKDPAARKARQKQLVTLLRRIIRDLKAEQEPVRERGDLADAPEDEQVPRLRREQGPLLRNEPPGRRTRRSATTTSGR